jgi:hypothetical protein
MTTQPTPTRPPRPDPLAIPGVIRIPLDPHQAAPFAGMGECFVAIARASYPSAPGWCMLVLPVDKETAAAACRVAMGKARTVRHNKGSAPA